MSLVISRDDSSGVSFAVFKPQPQFTRDDLLDCLSSSCSSFQKRGFAKFAILKSLSTSPSSWVAVYSIWKNAPAPDKAPSNEHSQLQAFKETVSSVAVTIHEDWYEIYCWDCKVAIPCPQLSQGDVVHLREIIGKSEQQELLPYSCLAILKAYFQQIEGLLSCTFYKSASKSRMIGLGVWQNAQAAYAFIGQAGGTPGECYWRSLGAKSKFLMYEVVFVTTAN